MDSVSGLATTTLYMLGGFQYQERSSIITPGSGADTLQFMGHEEGRARWAFHKYLDGDSAYAWEYDFFETDHLGNTRVVLTQQKDSAQYMATMEAANRAREMALFYNIDSTSYAVSAIPGGYPTDNTTTPNDSVARVNGNGHKMGPAILLKVMSGDSVAIGVKSFYHSNGTGGNPNSAMQNILNSLAGGLGAMTGANSETMSTLISSSSANPVYSALNSFLSTNDATPTGKPQAYLNWMLLDNQFNYVADHSGAIPVGGPDVINTLAKALGVHHSGFLYIWVSNETPGWDVFFDNLSVATFSGPMIEETHYYPFGLTMAGITDKALKLNYAENKYRFNKGSELQNNEFADGSGLEMYETHLRELDPQLGRWWQVDSKPEYSESPYSSMDDNPISKSDFMGDEAESEPGKPKKPGGHRVTLGNTGTNPNDPQYRQQVKRTLEINKNNRKNAPSLITVTAALTKGTYGAKAKVLGVGAEYSSSHNERDIVGFRDNKNVNKGEKTYKNGMSASLAGFGGAVTIESTKPMSPSGDLPAQYSTEQKISAPGVTAVNKSGEGTQYSGVETEVISAKVGFYIGIDFSITANYQTNNIIVNPPPNGNPIASDKATIQIYVPDHVPNPPTTSK